MFKYLLFHFCVLWRNIVCMGIKGLQLSTKIVKFPTAGLGFLALGRDLNGCIATMHLIFKNGILNFFYEML